jgi:hypothetical protein
MLAPIDDRRTSDRADGSNRRIRARRRVLLSATLETPKGELQVRLRNLSSTGALIEMAHPPEVGTLVTLRRGRTIAPGTVRWATSVSIGLEFIRPIQESEVLVHIGRPGASN